MKKAESISELKQSTATILAGMLSNPNVLTPCHLSGWRFCNTSPKELAQFAWELANHVEDAANEYKKDLK